MLLGGRSISPMTNKIKNHQPRQHATTSRSPIRKQIPMKTQTKAITHNKGQQKTKQTMGTLYLLQQVFNQLNFNQFDAFAQQRITKARQNITVICTFYKDQPICPKHQDLLNLYCQNEKQVICVSCVYKGNQQHKNHKIKPLQNVWKTIQYEIIRNQQKGKSLVNQLNQIKQQAKQIQNQISQNFMSITDNSLQIINQTIKQLQIIKQQYDSKLSLAYRRTRAIVNRYQQSIDLMIQLLQSNLQKASAMKKLGKYLLLKQINKQVGLIQEIITKFNQNKVLMEQWKRSAKQTMKMAEKKKKEGFKREDVYVVTQF